MICACSSRIVRPKAIISSRIAPAATRYARTPAVAPVWGGMGFDAGMLFPASGRVGRDRPDLGGHVVVGKAAVLHAEDLVGAYLGEDEPQLVEVAGHGLRLADRAHVRVVNAEAVVDVRTGDMELHGAADGDLVVAELPVPLVADRFDHLRLGAR